MLLLLLLLLLFLLTSACINVCYTWKDTQLVQDNLSVSLFTQSRWGCDNDSRGATTGAKNVEAKAIPISAAGLLALADCKSTG